MGNAHTQSNILSDGLPRILPPYENGVFQAILTLPEAHAALVSSVAVFTGRKVKNVTLRNNDVPTRDAGAKREQYAIQFERLANKTSFF